MLHGDGLVLHGLCLLLSRVQGGDHTGIRLNLVKAHAAADTGQLLKLCPGCRPEALQSNIHLFQKLGNQPILLLQQSHQQMDLLQLGVVILRHQLLGGLDGLFGFIRIDIKIHKSSFFLGGLALYCCEC